MSRNSRPDLFEKLSGVEFPDANVEDYHPTKTDPYGRTIERTFKVIALTILFGAAGGLMWGAWDVGIEPIRSGVHYGFFRVAPIFNPTYGWYYHRIPFFELIPMTMFLIFATGLIRAAVKVIRSKTR